MIWRVRLRRSGSWRYSLGCFLALKLQYIGQSARDASAQQPTLFVIPGRALARTRNLEIPGLVLRTIPE
jgi:hypothetical protein